MGVSSDSVANPVHLREAGLITCWNELRGVGILRACNEATISLYRAILQVGELWKNVLYCMDDYDTDMGAIIQIYMGIHTGESRRP